MKKFLIQDYSVDKALFIKDVGIYKNIYCPRMRKKIGLMIYKRYVFVERHHIAPLPDDRHSVFETFVNDRGFKKSQFLAEICEEPILKEIEKEASFSLLSNQSNPIGVHGKTLDKIIKQVKKNNWSIDIFDGAKTQVLIDLRLDVFPRFKKSKHYKVYIQFKEMEYQPPNVCDFSILRCLGRGAFGYVNACIKRDTGIAYAMKIIRKCSIESSKSAMATLSERNSLAAMDSKFVICLKYAMTDEKRLYYILDLCPGGDLKFHISNVGRFPPSRAKFYAAEILMGIAHIHKQGYIYRDIKFENILLELTGHAKISDLGLSCKYIDSHDHKVTGYAGTPGYTAPEVVLQRRYGKEADWFSFGVLIYRMLCGKKPFHKARRSKRKKSHHTIDTSVVHLQPEFGVHFDEISADFVGRLLEKDPIKRLGYDGVEHIMQHEFFDELNFGLLEGGFLDPPYKPGKLLGSNVETLENLAHVTRRNTSGTNERLPCEYEEILTGFPYYSARVWQVEVVRMLESLTGEVFDRFVNNTQAYGTQSITKNLIKTCCTIN